MIGLKRGNVELSEPSDEWAINAEATVKKLRELFGKVAVAVEHVGSTSINGIKAKPIIDIAVAVSSFDDVIPLIPSLEAAGFVHRKHSVDDDMLFVCGDFTNEIRTHHIHVVPFNSAEWRNYLNFRDYLNSFPAVAKEYEELKIRLMTDFPTDREAYTNGKAEFITKVLRAALPWSFLGKTINVIVDRPLGSVHPKHPNIIYTVNYGYIPGVISGDGEELDAYILGVNEPVTEFSGVVVGVIYRENDNEDKLVVAPTGVVFNQAEIYEAVSFQEQYFKVRVECLRQKSCGVAVYRKNGGKKEYLLLLQEKSQTWSFPKGHMEAGETEIITAARELYEETGLTVELMGKPRMTVVYPISRNVSKEVVLFIAQTDDEPKPRQGEIACFRWVSADEAKKMLYKEYDTFFDFTESI